jgi:hypothetical protein
LIGTRSGGASRPFLKQSRPSILVPSQCVYAIVRFAGVITRPDRRAAIRINPGPSRSARHAGLSISIERRSMRCNSPRWRWSGRPRSRNNAAPKSARSRMLRASGRAFARVYCRRERCSGLSRGG